MIRMYRYSEGDRSFILVDGRNVEVRRFREKGTVHSLCLMDGADALAIVDNSEKADFRMECYGADGLRNGMDEAAAVCCVAFADLLGVKPFHTAEYSIETPQGIVEADILSHLGECKTVKLNDSGYTGSAICEGQYE